MGSVLSVFNLKGNIESFIETFKRLLDLKLDVSFIHKCLPSFSIFRLKLVTLIFPRNLPPNQTFSNFPLLLEFLMQFSVNLNKLRSFTITLLHTTRNFANSHEPFHLSFKTFFLRMTSSMIPSHSHYASQHSQEKASHAKKKLRLISISLGFCYLLSIYLSIVISSSFHSASDNFPSSLLPTSPVRLEVGKNKNIKQKETKRDYFVGPGEHFFLPFLGVFLLFSHFEVE
jgi:hypothetical protein